MIITREMILKAIENLRPGIETVLNIKGYTWGPRWVDGFVNAPGINDRIQFRFGQKTDWNSVWGPPLDFEEIASAKFHLSERTGKDTADIVTEEPWVLEEGEYLFGGGCSHHGINVGVSGAYSRTDHLFAKILAETIEALAFLEADRLKKAGAERIQ